MAEKLRWGYERLKEDGKIEYAPSNDYDGKITGHIVFGVKEWFDENPEERIRLGWIKHIYHETKDIEYDRHSQYLVKQVAQIDEYTVEDQYHILDKSEEMMRIQELTNSYWDTFEDSFMFR